MQVYRVRISEENGWFIGKCEDETIVISDGNPIQTSHNVKDSMPDKYRGNYFETLERHILLCEIDAKVKYWANLLRMAGGYKIYV